MNRGRWIVDCPHEECAWAYLATNADGAPVYFHRCDGDPGRAPGCGQQFSLAWPPLDVALEIERLLFQRPQSLTRNWCPPMETVESIMRENDQLLVGWNLERLADAGIGVKC